MEFHLINLFWICTIESFARTFYNEKNQAINPYEVGKKYGRASKTSASSRIITATKTDDTVIQSNELQPNENRERQSPEVIQEQDADDSYFNLKKIKKRVLEFIYSLKF